MSSPSSDHGSGPGEQTDTHTKDPFAERTDSLAEPKGPENMVMNLPNISISPPDTPAILKDGEEQNSYAGEFESSAQKARYEGLRYSVDMTGGSSKYTGLGLTEKLPGSVSRARAEAQRRLQENKTQQVDTAMRANPTPTSTSGYSSPAKYQRAVEKVIRGSSAPKSIAFSNNNNNNEAPKPGGKWRCCKCNRGHQIYSYAQGQHPASVLSCECTHRSCSKCTLEGLIKQFVPMSEPEVVHLSEDSNKAIRFGVFCEGCGLSWRAEKIPDEVKNTAVKSALLRVSALPRRLTKRGGVHPLERLRPSRSMNNLHDLTESHPHATSLTASKSALNLRALSKEMKKEHGEQAEPVSVKFAGIKCTCGMTTESSSLCFQIMDPPKDFNQVQFAKQSAARNVAGFGSTPADRAKGHGTPTLTLRGKRHPNPLRSNPVD